ncbi:MAG: DUF4124 domain-containing protein [Luteimonas sp.]
MIRPAALALLLLPPLLLAAASGLRAAGNVTLYHCTDAKGRLTISDVPCPKGQQQDTRTMLRPQDPSPRPARAAAAAPAGPAHAQPIRVVVLQPPRPLNECVTADGERYTSDTGDGRPRYVPLWTLGYPVARLAYTGGIGGRARASSGLSAPASAGLSIPPARERPRQPDLPAWPRPPRPGVHPGYGYGGATTFVRDACYFLPQAEVCDRLVDRRDEIRTRFFNAQQSERAQLRIEERGLNARLANDCGVR